MHGFLKSYSDSNPEKFNKDFIYQKKNDSILEHLIDASKTLEIIDGIKFISGELITDESKIRTKSKNKQKYISIEESRYDLAILKFEITGLQNKELKKEEYTIELFTPKIIKDFYYLLNGSRFYPIYQVIDAATYHTKNAVTQKTLLMPIVIKFKKCMYEATDGFEYYGCYYFLVLFKNKINIFNYYFANFGFKKTIKYFGFENDIKFSANDIEQTEDTVVFKINKNLSMSVTNTLIGDSDNNSIVLTLLNALMTTNGIKYTNLNDDIFWKKKLGCFFTKTTDPATQIEKAEKILVSVRRILDNGTKKTLRIDDEDKEDTFAIIRYILRNYNTLIHLDNMDLRNKRLRLKEHECQDFTKLCSSNSYRLLNSKDPSFDEKLSIFTNISPMFFIKQCGKSNPLLAYYNGVNTMDIILALKFSQRGPQSISENGSSVKVRFRGPHPSYLGRIDLITCSNNDPGLTGTLSPFIKTYDYFFSKENVLITTDINDDDDFDIDMNEYQGSEG